MPRTVVTSQTLRYLRRLCDAAEPVTTPHLRTPTMKSIRASPGPTITRAHIPPPRHQLHQRRALSTAHTILQEQQSSTSTSRVAEPSSPTIPDITNFYTLFPSTLPSGPPPSGSFAIPLGTLKREFLQLQSQHHPDKYSTSPTQHSKSLALSSLLNNAYKTLSDPLLRARYLLEHTYNIDITSEDNSTHRGVTDQATLMEVMEAQEAIEAAHDQEQIDALKIENRKRIQEAEQKLARAFEAENVNAAKTECVRLNYWRTLQQGLDDWEPGKEVRLIH
ncbi:uncharacterized protein A1O9_09034 [Exophiala aquamarina CBS 119918]|uniref:J domain-containing protein n=1 Tax=Exophiala aquamarina CBS 119918 TaxID=1182545 RepID=A0A072P4F4_9EURO|nr:uncharacterized protein A1O9_09034 [Exophiala aquamarina CBS 119918]KEF54592.1 hypothetical protein A1O9_09034 [Exophiala aquamarina CBS 119918]